MLVLFVAGGTALTGQAAGATVLPANFQETTVFSGLTNPTSVAFASDGRVFVAEKNGRIKMFDNLSDASATTTVDLSTNTYNFWDRGMLGMALHPNYPASPYLYVLYTYDALPGGLAPQWGTPGVLSDPCPALYGATADGCVVTGRLSRVPLSNGVANGPEQPLIADWCQQYPSHSIGSMAFGSDGALYVSGGDGASFNFTDYGQDGNPVNPCGDPPGSPGTVLTPPTAEGGALRSQDYRAGTDPVSLDGTVLRLNPDTGAAMPGNPLGFSSDANARRIVADGLRNPFRLAVRPGTNDVWVGDVGWNNWEEVNRLGSVTDLTVDNFGWPCYEGTGRQSGYDAANLNICESLYSAGAGAHRAPHYTYSHAAKVVNNETCPTGGSSIAGMSFYDGGNYPSQYLGALFFADYSRKCIWAMRTGANGIPDANVRETFAAGAANPVDVKTGPNGDVFYADFDGGTIRRIRYLGTNNAPVAVATATPVSGPVPLNVSFNGSGSSDADGQPLTYSWDLNGDGTYGDATIAQPTYTYTAAGLYTARLRVTDSLGASDTENVVINANATTPPSATILSPSASTNWKVGDTINFSGMATDAEDGTLPGTALSWSLILQHCPSNCHSHPLQDFLNTPNGSFAAPDHDYPSHLELRLTATDSSGATDTESVLLSPQTVNLTFASVPQGLQLAVGGTQGPTPFTRTVIAGSTNSAAAITPQATLSRTYAFTSWSDGGAQTHSIVAPASSTTYTATYADTGPAPPDGLVAAYGFEESSGSTAADSSGTANVGTLEGGTQRTSSGRYGSALFFDGINDAVRVEDSPSLDLTAGMTLEAWVRPQSLVGWNTVLMKEQATTLSYGLYGNSNTNVPVAEAYISGGVRRASGGGQIPLNAWTHLAATYDGSLIRIYVDGAQVGQTARTGPITTSTSALRIGGNAIWPEWFHGEIDDVRIYSRALLPVEIQADMNTPTIAPPPGDTEPPSAPTNLTANGTFGQVALSWTAATDNVGVAKYNVHRSTIGSFLPNEENRIGQVTTGTTYLDSPLAPGVYFYKVVAEDAIGLKGPASSGASGTVPADTAAPSAPAGLTTSVSGSDITLNWNAATDNVGVTRYNLHRGTTQGFLPGPGNRIAQPTGTSYPDTGLTPGTYYYVVTAQDAVPNVGAPSNEAAATVVSPPPPPPPPPSLVAAYSFDEGLGATANDLSGSANHGAVNGASWATAGRFGQALSFDGVNDRVTVPDSSSLDLTTGITMEAWVRPTALGTAWKTVLFKHRNLNATNMVYVLYGNRNTSVPIAEVTTGTTSVKAVNGTSQLPLNTWSHLASTYDGANLRLFVNGSQVASFATTGLIATSTGDLWIGGNNVWAEWFTGLIDEVRIYNRALTAAEIATDMNTSVGVPDTVSPSAPANLQKTGSTATSISISWTASTDNVGVAGYRVFRGTTEVGTTTGTTFTVPSLTCGSTHELSVEAFDFSNNEATSAPLSASTSACDTTPPTVSVTSPAAGATVSGANVGIAASASDNDAVAGVQFLLDGLALGPEDTSAPYEAAWNTFPVSNGPHTLAARARDASGLLTTSAPVSITVSNTAPPPVDGLVAAYAFDEGSGTAVGDLSGNANHGALNGPTWAPGRFGQALSFDGINDRVAIPDSNSLDVTTGVTMEAWVRPTALGTAWKTTLFKHRDGNLSNMMYVLYANRNTSVPLGEVTTGTTSVKAVNGTSQLPLNTWSHLASTYDGANLRLYVNGAQVATLATTGQIAVSNGELWIGGNAVWAEWFTGLIDEVRIYRRALTAAEITTDMNTSVGVPDTQAPTAPGNLQKTGAGATSISLSWTPSTDNVGVAGYRVFRGATEVGTTTGTTFTIPSLTCGSSHDISVEAYDFSQNASTRATLTASTADCDTTLPTVTVTEPAAGATVSGTTVNVAATASDNDVVAGVQFFIDGVVLGSEDTVAPYTATWNSWNNVNGLHAVTARARDASNNLRTSTAVNVTVTNTGSAPAPGLVASYGFDEGSGSSAADITGNGNAGTVNGPAWTIGRFGQALNFDGVNDRVAIPDSNVLDLTTGMTIEAWVKPTVLGTAWKTMIFKHRNANATNMVYVMYGNRNTSRPVGEITVGTTIKAANGSTQLPLDVWSHLATTYDGATVRLFVNGAQVGSLATTGPIATSTGDVWIGGNNVWGEWFSGAIDEVRIYNRALPATEIQADMNRAAAPDSDPPGIVSLSPADGTTGVGVGGTATATFDEAMNGASITASTFELRNSANALVPATVSYDALTGRATLTPSAPLSFDSTYTATVRGGASGVKDLAGNPLAANRVWSFLTAPPPPPIAVFSATANRFGAYAVELLKAEGLNSVDNVDLSTLNAASLSGRDVVVLGEAPLTAEQVTALTNWVNGGGNLIALRPDKQLAGLLGLTDQAATLTNAYMRIDTTPGSPGNGLTSVSMQFHGTADRYALNGATAVATLYSNASTATANPAVTLRGVGASGGQAAAFTYDLSRSVVYTRQGNPAWAGQNRDGIGPPRPNDLFFGNMATDPQPDWVDTLKLGIPQADEQQRLLANLALSMNRDRKPLPRLWYFPRDEKAAIVMTGDDHAVGGTAGRFDQHKAQSSPGCSVADWDCVRGTSYIYPNSPLTNAQANSYNADGFEVALHLNTSCATTSPAQINADLRDQLAEFVAKYSSVPSPQTNRTHCVAWSDWATQPKTELAHGVRLDTNYYHYPASWIGTLPGFMTGSGLIMRFADTDGTAIDTWQSHTHMNDEAGQAYPGTVNALLDGAIGPNGYYGFFNANMHTDNAVHAGADAIVASAQARGVPIITAKQLLDWTDGRDRSTMTSFTWSGNTLGFTLRPGTGARGLRAMLPTSTTTTTLSGITRDGAPVPFTTQTIKGIEYAVFEAQNGRYAAAYA